MLKFMGYLNIYVICLWAARGVVTSVQLSSPMGLSLTQ
jgi:hypothetical protein